MDEPALSARMLELVQDVSPTPRAKRARVVDIRVAQRYRDDAWRDSSSEFRDEVAGLTQGNASRR
jgi:hypothetical protein